MEKGAVKEGRCKDQGGFIDGVTTNWSGIKCSNYSPQLLKSQVIVLGFLITFKHIQMYGSKFKAELSLKNLPINFTLHVVFYHHCHCLESQPYYLEHQSFFSPHLTQIGLDK
jgi:hypothetical protein